MLQFLFKQMSQDQKGQDLAEYALLIGLIAIVVIGAVTMFGSSLNTYWTTITTAFPSP